LTQNKKLASIISDSSYLPAKAPKTKSLSKGIESDLFDLLDNPVMTEPENLLKNHYLSSMIEFLQKF